MLQAVISSLLLTSTALTGVTAFCRPQSGNDHEHDIYLNVLKWKEPEMRPSEQGIEFECQTGFLQNELDENKEIFMCDKGKYNGSYEFPDLLCRSDYHQQIHCLRVPGDKLNSTILQCNTPNVAVYEIRRKTNGTETIVYKSCLDTNTMRPKFSFKPPNYDDLSVRPKSRHDVWGFDGYGKNSDERVKLSQGYVQKRQKQRLTSSFPEKYSKGKEYPYYFNRGHLTAYSDFEHLEDQKATVQYINAAPQWEVLNSHSWSLVEREVRNTIATNPQIWEVYTGTYGAIPTTRGPLFLVPVFDRTGKFLRGQLPVPLVFWKLAHNIKDRTKSRVFVGVNNPEIRTAADIGPAYRLCAHPVKNGNKLIEGDEYKGFTYECPLDVFLVKLNAEEKVVKSETLL